MPCSRPLLVGDIGGTSARLSLHVAGERKKETIFRSREHPSFESIAARFLEGTSETPAVAVFGIAGPVEEGRAVATNLPWTLDEGAIAARLGIPRVKLFNDLVVAAYGCLHAEAEEILLLTDTKPQPHGRHVALMAAGTGLGQARLVWHGAGHVGVASEGGHADFAPRSELEVELWRFLAARHADHVSYERLLSGNGLGAIYDFFATRGPAAPPSIVARLEEGDRNAAIAELGLSRAFEPAAQAVDLFATLYGAEAGNLALRELAFGGVFITGNIGRHILPARRARFLDAFRAKGRLAGTLARVPVAVVTNPLVGVRGALALAEQMASAPPS